MLRVGLALTLVSAAALADGAHKFVFTAYGDAAGGADVIAGRYGVALEKLKRDSGNADFDASITNTNRCVAYSMTLQWQEAHAACDAAVHAASRQRTAGPSWWSWVPAADDDRLAVAYANRAVMYWLSNDDAAAREDLVEAQKLSPQADFVARNLVALEVHSELVRAKAHQVAQAAAPSPKS